MSVSNGPSIPVMINAATGDNFDVDFRKFLRAFHALLTHRVIDHTLATPPGSPANGDRYIVAGSPTGAWSGKANQIAVWTTDNPVTPSGLWEFYAPAAGWVFFSGTANLQLVYTGSAWSPLQVGALVAYTVATLPASPLACFIAYASDGVKHGETTGGGTGCPVYFSNTQWRRYSDDTQVIS